MQVPAHLQQLIDLGVYLTTAVNAENRLCYPKQHNQRVLSLARGRTVLVSGRESLSFEGDVAIQAINVIARHSGDTRVIPAGPTYKLRNRQYFFWGKRLYPSYLQVGPSFNIEKSKRRMIAEDIQRALAYISASTCS